MLKATYIGSIQVRRPSGMETLNDAIDQMASQVPADQWREVNVAVAPSVVTITDAEVNYAVIFLSHFASTFLIYLRPLLLFSVLTGCCLFVFFQFGK